MNTLGLRARIGLTVIGLLGLWSAAEGKVVYVAKTGDNTNDGLSWANAKATVWAGLGAARSGDEIWVAAGTYVERIALQTEVALYGGFAGDETDRAQRNWKANATVLDGDARDTVVGVWFKATPATRVDGFTIRNGRPSSRPGGGIYCNGSPTIANNLITGNAITFYGGGGIYCCESSAPMITNNIITGNFVDRSAGGGIYCGSYSSPTIANNVISGNTAVTGSSGFGGGGIYCDSRSAKIINNLITGNVASGYFGNGGGIYCGGVSATIANNMIVGNVASKSGGGICCKGAPTIANNTIADNIALSGGGISYAESPTITNTIVAFNSSGICVSSGSGSGAPVLRYNCVFGNRAYDYSGLADPTGTDGNISSDPKLAALVFANVHIQPDSPCKDAGDDAQVQGDWRDVDGEARIQGVHVDIGADESDGTAWPAGPRVVVRVSSNGNDANDGSSWGHAKRTVQAGIDRASALGGEVWVQAGIYRERIILHPYVYAYGGFAGTEESLGQRDWTSRVSVLDGQAAGTVVTVMAGEGISTVDGFTIRNGRSVSSGGGISCQNSSPIIANNAIAGNIAVVDYGGYAGAGIYCGSRSSPMIINNRITGNTASGGGFGGNGGGGIYCSSESSPRIINNTITGNNSDLPSAAFGSGGIACEVNSSPTIVNTIVAFNTSGIGNWPSSTTLTLRNNCVYGNTAYNYSSTLADPTGSDGNISADPKLVGLAYGDVHIQPDSPCKDAGDDTQVQEGGRDIDGQARIQGSHVDIGADESDGSVRPAGPYIVVRVGPNGNDANDGSSWALAKRTVQAGIDMAGAMGGEVWVQAGLYKERVILHPYAYVYGGFAGTEDSRGQRRAATQACILDGEASGSVVSVLTGDRVSVIDGFTIRNGQALDGGGIYCGYGSPTIANNTITDNSSGIYCYRSSPTITNNTIVGNTVFGIYGGSGLPTIVNTIIAFNCTGIQCLSASVLRHNCVYGNTVFNCSGPSDPTGTDGNISADPKLAGASYGNVHIQPDSPCKDAGDDGQVQADWRDIDGQARIQGSHVDIGADESDGTLCPTGPYVIVRVSPNGDDANDGSSWASAKRTVQDGVDLASRSGGEVWVQAGTYQERITLHPYVHMYGGFAGSETSRDQRDWRTRVTVLDGQSRGSVVSMGMGWVATTIDGFTIHNGNADSGGGVLASGGGVIANDVITGNTASSGGGVSGKMAFVVNSTIKENLVGGGIYCSGPTMIAGNVITGNHGHGIHCLTSAVTIGNNTIVGNGGDGIHGDSNAPMIVNTIVAFNSSGISCGTAKHIARCNCVYGNTAYNYYGLTDPTGTDGNISVDPKFAGASYGNVHIQPDSPCKDAGEDVQVQTDWLDIDGQVRIQGSHVDIGADESDGTVWPAGPYVIVRVNPNGDDANDGSSWGSAKRTVQAGIDLANWSGGEVWVQAGTYQERITLHAYVHAYGGFSGTETSRDQRDWRTQATILDGQAAGSVVSVQTGWQASTIDGFTIRNGRASNGAGVYCSAASPTIAHNTIVGNSASGAGGGIYCTNSSPTIEKNIIMYNTAQRVGGGICCISCSPTIANNAIVGSAGGGIYCESSSSSVVNNTITGNGGSGLNCYSGSAMVVNNTITGNSGSTGAGIYASYASLTISNTIVAFNSSGIYTAGSGTMVLRNNCVHGNRSYDYSGLTAPTGIDGNISVDPRLAAAAYGNVHIQPDSPCKDAGDDAMIQAGWQDIDGQDRLQASHVDIGADESDGNVQPAGPYVVVRVSSDGDDANDGSSWALAKKTVQAGIAMAGMLGGEVWIQAGTYWERITLYPHVYVYGGFAGTEESRDRRDWTIRDTILDGQAAGSVVTVSAGEKVSALDGLTIRNGRASYGGGIYCSSASPTIVNNAITANSSYLGNGGGIWCSGTSASLIAYNRIVGNSATRIGATSDSGLGGGVCCLSSLATITHNTIDGNSASRGGGVMCYGSSITDNSIAGNTASSGGGGIYCGESSTLTVGNNAILNNSAAYGGGIYIEAGSASIIRNTIMGNIATSLGGGLHLYSGSTTITNNAILGNSAGDGGGIFCGTGSASIVGNTITGNIATSCGGGLFLYDGATTITNNTITGGRASLEGGGVFCGYDSSPKINNTIIAFNSSGFYVQSKTLPALRSNCVYRNTAYNFRGLTDPTGAVGNVSVDPLFVRTPTPGADGLWGTADDDPGDLHLRAGSPCIDAGDNGAVPAGILTDLAGLSRFLNDPATPDTGLGTMPIVDMGAYEYVAGDFDRDGDIDADDLKAFAACASGPAVAYTGDCAAADFDKDGDVDQSDFGFIQRCFSGAGELVDPTCGR